MPPKFWASWEDSRQDDRNEHAVSSTGISSHPQNWNILSPNNHPDNQDVARSNDYQKDLGVVKSPPILERKELGSRLNLALLEDRCRTEAAKALNGKLLKEHWLSDDDPQVQELGQVMFKKMKRELIKAGLLAENTAEEDHNLNSYVKSLDAYLQNIAASELNQNVPLVLEDPGALLKRKEHNVSDELDPITYPLKLNPAKNLSLSSERRALVRRIRPDELDTTVHSLNLHSAKTYPQSVYSGQYEEMSLLGSGGEGAVYKARDTVDRGVYAIKKVVIPAKKLRQYQRQSVSLSEKLKEVVALAKLNHPNIVRYHHSWLEYYPIGTYGASQKKQSFSSSSSGTSELGRDNFYSKSPSKVHTIATLERDSIVDEISNSASEEMTSSLAPASYSEADESLSREIEKLQFGFTQQDLLADLDQLEDNDKTYDEELVVFGHSSNTNPETEDADQSNYTDERHNKPRQWFAGSPELDAVLYIKMTAYTCTLDSLLKNSNTGSMIPQHCFHILPTIRILITLIDGLQYIHRKGIIHQDIKPANIFLSVLEAGEPATPAYVNITNCPDCVVSGHIRPLYICSHIGDFGMIKDISSNPALSTSTDIDDSSKALLYSNTSVYKAGDSFLAGTGFYKPPWVRGVKPIICPKRDCYALGAVALEMICRFGSKSERVHVFSQIRDRGVFPREVKDSALGECVIGMLCADREERWGLERVRGFLVGSEGRLCG